MTESNNEKNILFFKNELPSLLSNVAYQDKFVIIHDQKIAGVHDSFASALNDAVTKFPPNEFIIQQVINEKEWTNFIRSAVA